MRCKLSIIYILVGISLFIFHTSSGQSRLSRKRLYQIEVRDSFYGVVDSNQRIIIPFEYQKIDFSWSSHFFKVKKDNKYGFINNKNQLIIKPEYKSIDWFDVLPSNFIKAEKGNKTFAFNYQGRQVNIEPYDDIELLENGNFIALNNNKQFLIDSLGRIVSKPYSNITSINKKMYIVHNTYDNNYKSIIRAGILSFNCGGIKIYIDYPEYKGKYGIMNDNGQEIIPLNYDYLHKSNGSNLVAMICKNGKNKYGYIDTKGKEIIPIQYDSISYTLDGLVIAKLANSYYFLNERGKELTPTHFDSIYHRYGDIQSRFFFCVMKNGLCGLIDSKGNFRLPLQYDYIGDYKNGLINACINNKCGYLDLNNRIKIPFQYDFCYPFYEDLARVVANNKLGFIDTNGKIAIPIMYEKTTPHFIEKDGKRVLKVGLGSDIYYVDEKNHYLYEESSK